ncbi:50S ribosomal protein L9 [Candidatus Dependentiae bacterium]|nr:MAG: 50S ribosomal protein L9 [Candidatus Dependentiae bacterium]
MKVFMKKNLVNVGLTGEMVSVDDGYGRNYLIPKGFAVEVTAQNEHSFKLRAKIVDKRNEIIESNTSILAQKIKETKLIIKKKMHDDGKLYGSINQNEIIHLLKDKGILLSKNQLQLDKTIKSKGFYIVPVSLTSRLKTELAIEVVSE